MMVSRGPRAVLSALLPVFGIVLCVPLLAAPATATTAVTGATGSAVTTMTARTVTAPSLHQVQQRILAQTNAYRARRGLRPLRLDPVMSRVATRWSRHQAAAHEMSHNPGYPRQIPDGWNRCGENVAYGYRWTAVTQAWFHSPPHRHNLLGHYGRIGIGYALDSHGVPYYTQDFGRY
ncbi:MAG: CAP domain-containing protein [Marmoricola sp.]